MFWRSFFERPGARRAASAVCTKRLAVSVAWRADASASRIKFTAARTRVTRSASSSWDRQCTASKSAASAECS